MSNEELAKVLAGHKEFIMKAMAFYKKENKTRVVMYNKDQVEEALERAITTLSPWISVEDRLPGDGGTVLVTLRDGRIRTARRVSILGDKLVAWSWSGGKHLPDERVALWMPLPPTKTQ